MRPGDGLVQIARLQGNTFCKVRPGCSSHKPCQNKTLRRKTGGLYAAKCYPGLNQAQVTMDSGDGRWTGTTGRGLLRVPGRTVITYSWGNQQGTEFLAEAADGVIDELLGGLLPTPKVVGTTSPPR